MVMERNRDQDKAYHGKEQTTDCKDDTLSAGHIVVAAYKEEEAEGSKAPYADDDTPSLPCRYI